MTVLNVARYIIEQKGELTTMKLQKLTYYCQAWSLAWDGVPLFDEEFQAWANGPVCTELFKEHRGIYKVEADFLEGYDTSSFTDEQIETINVVLDDYGEETPHYLSELTHKERPWRETRGQLADGESSSDIIEKDLMQEYYGGLI
ncbi:Panacea domain-containing protein [Vagococcus sp. JNUCC 83]